MPARPPGETSTASANLARLVTSLSHSERAPATEIRKLQDQLFSALSAHHFEFSPSYRERLLRANIRDGNLKSLRAVSPIRRRDIQDAGEGFAARHVPESHLPVGRVKTSGSTGEPVGLPKTARNSMFWSAFTIRDHAWNHRNFLGRLSAIRANLSSYVEWNTWGLPVSPLFKTGPAQGIPITTPVERQAELIDTFRPDILLVYPSNLGALLDTWSNGGPAHAPHLKHLKTIGETVSPELRTRTREILGLEIEDNYSSQEAGPIAIQCPEGGLYHIMSEALIVEILDENDTPCSTGTSGRVIITDLHNYAAPLVRYDIGDIAEVGPSCTCGRTLPTLKRILGRERNLVRHRNGDRHWPLVGFHRFADVAPVQQYQFIQHSLDEIEFRVVVREPLTPIQQDQLIAICSSALGSDFQFRITRFCDWLPKGTNGKFEEFVCRIS